MDHFLVEFPDPASRAVTVGQEHPVETPVRDGAARCDGEPSGPGQGEQPVVAPLQAGPQFREIGAGIGAEQQLQDRVEGVVPQTRVGMGTPHRRQPGLDSQSRISRGSGRGDGLLSQDVERQHRDTQFLDPAREHVGDGHDRCRQLPAVQGVEASLGGRAHLVSGPPETLQRTRSGQGGADLDHLVDGAHVDAQLQGARGHDGPQPPRLERVLDLGPDLFADRTVVGASQVLTAAGIQPQLVEASRQLLRRPAGVREHQRGPGPQDRIQDLLLHVGPGIVQRGSVDPDVPAFPGPGSHHDHVPVAPEEGRHLFDGTHGGGQGHTPHVAPSQQVQALQAEGQVGAAFGTGDGVDLVDYHRLDVAEGFPGRGREHQIQRLGCGDQHIRWPAPHSVAVAGRGVA